MQRPYFIALAVAIVSCQMGVALAQNAPGSAATTAAPAAAAAGSAAAPAATAAPPASDKTATTTAPASDKPTATTEKSAEPKKKKAATKKMTRQQEIDKSIDSGTVPSRYRSQVPKQYQQYVPFDKQ
jgi:hypothetical protein